MSILHPKSLNVTLLCVEREGSHTVDNSQTCPRDGVPYSKIDAYLNSIWTAALNITEHYASQLSVCKEYAGRKPYTLGILGK